MKKLILLFTMACAAGQLYGMLEVQNIMDLPEDVRNEIISMALASSNDLNDTIKAIKAGVLRGVRYDNLKAFTALMDILAKKFPNMSRKQIAEQFNTPIAKEYVTLGEQLFWPANRTFANRRGERSPVEDIKELLEKDADPNYTGGQVGYQALESTHSAILNNGKMEGSKYENGVAILKLLLEAGAKPTEGFMVYEQKRVNKKRPPAELRQELFNLIKQYIKK